MRRSMCIVLLVLAVAGLAIAAPAGKTYSFYAIGVQPGVDTFFATVYKGMKAAEANFSVKLNYLGLASDEVNAAGLANKLVACRDRLDRAVVGRLEPIGHCLRSVPTASSHRPLRRERPIGADDLDVVNVLRAWQLRLGVRDREIARARGSVGAASLARHDRLPGAPRQ